MMRKYADIRIAFTVAFDDNGELDLNDQAIDEAMCSVSLPPGIADFEIIGEVRDTELPDQPTALSTDR